jgi:transketolase
VTKDSLDELCVNTIRMLAVEAVQRANSGHPGLPMGAATMGEDALVNHWTYVLASDGDMMKGVTSEAASLAATLRLGRLIVLYDANGITLSAAANLTFSEDVGTRFVLRPSDAAETAEAWRVALAHSDGPVDIVLTRQKVPMIDRKQYASSSALAQGAYVLADADGSAPSVILIATGSEVSVALEAHQRLAKEGIGSRVVSMPSWELFDRQPQSYRDAVLPPSIRARVSIEAASSFGWERYVGAAGAIIGVDRFGASAPGPTLMHEFGFTAKHVVETAKAIVQRMPPREGWH